MTTPEEILGKVPTMSVEQLEDAIFGGTVPVKEVFRVLGPSPKTDQLKNSLRAQLEPRWQAARKANYREDYEEFKAIYPTSSHSVECNMRMAKAMPRPVDENRWRTMDKTSVDALSAFISEYPDSRHCEEAKVLRANLIDNLPDHEKAWQTIDKTNVDALEKFISDFGTSLHCREACELIEQLLKELPPDNRAWRTCNKNSLEELADFVEQYHMSPFAAEARRRYNEIYNSLPADERAWIELDKNDYDALSAFLEQYPESGRCQEAISLQQRIVDSWEDDDRDWFCIDRHDYDALTDFINRYPKSVHIEEAQKLLRELDDEDDVYDDLYFMQLVKDIRADNMIDDTVSAVSQKCSDLVRTGKYPAGYFNEFILSHPNFFYPAEIRKMRDAGLVSFKRLKQRGIKECFINELISKRNRTEFSEPDRIDRISNLSTEVYFWGLPSSGKSCAIGAILSVAGNGHVAQTLEYQNCQGYEYMCHLATNFSTTGQVGLLPAGTKVTSTYEMFFHLHDDFNKVHQLTIIDLAGELMRCFYLQTAGKPLNDDQQQAWDTLQRLLVSQKSKSRKIHFFVIEYGAEKDTYDGIGQSIYLSAVAQEMKKLNLFREDTDAIYIMFTKVDRSGLTGQPLVNELTRHVEQFYKGFHNALADVCAANEINGGKLLCIPFTLGEVCFKDFCLFDETAASNVVKELLVRSAAESKNAIIGGLAK